MSTRLLQRQILPLDRDFDVLPLYIDAEAASLDADKYEVGANRHAREMNAVSMRQNVSSGHHIHPDQIESRTRLRIPQPWMWTSSLSITTVSSYVPGRTQISPPSAGNASTAAWMVSKSPMLIRPSPTE